MRHLWLALAFALVLGVATPADAKPPWLPEHDTFCLYGLSVAGEAVPGMPAWAILGLSVRTDKLEGQQCLSLQPPGQDGGNGRGGGNGGGNGGGGGGKGK